METKAPALPRAPPRAQELAKAEMLNCIKEEPLRPVTKKVGGGRQLQQRVA